MPIIKNYTNSDTLVIAATGLLNKLNLPVDDFFTESGLCEYSNIVLKDPTKMLTLAGMSPQFPSFFDLVDHLKYEIQQMKPERLIVTGTSGGGHTALLMGHLLKADFVVAFNPYTYLSHDEAEALGDEPLKAIHEKRILGKKISDEVKHLTNLKMTLSNWNNKTKYYLHVSRFHRWDYQRARYLKNVRGLSIIRHPYAIHSLAQPLAREEKLKRCFDFPYKQTLNSKDVYRYFAYAAKKMIGRSS